MATGIWKEKSICKRKRPLTDGDEESEVRSENSELCRLTKLVSVLTESVTRMGSPTSSNRTGSEVVPIFNPEEKNQDVLKWIRKTNELRVIYGWDERTTIDTWYQSLTTIDFSWEEWKIKLTEAFPTDFDYDQQLEEMLRRTKRRNESMTKYFYEKLALLNMCEISGRKAVACIIGGIPDPTIKAVAKVKDFGQPEGLLRFLKTLSSSSDKLRTVSAIRKEIPTTSGTAKSLGRRCYGCGSKEHILPQCPSKVNKSIRNNPIQKPQMKQVLTLQEAEESGNKYFKNAFINGVSVDVYVDLGASCNVLIEEFLSKLDLKHDNKVKLIKGYGGNVVKCLGIVKNVLVKVDDVEAYTSFLIVPDDVQKIPAIIGQPFTEQAHVVIYKDSEHLNFLNKEIFPSVQSIECDKVDIRLKNTVVIPPRHSINAKCLTEGNKLLYIDSSIRLKENNEYFLPRCVVETDSNGRCFIPVINPTDKEIVIRNKKIFARAKFCKSSENSILRIEDASCDDLRDKFGSLNIGETLNEHQVNNVTQLLKNYEDCFASSLSQLGCTTVAELHIDLIDEKPVVYRPYRMNQSSREKVKEIVNDLLKNNIIRESNSPFASPIVLVKKKNGEQRLCIDYRMLNHKMKQDHFPLPRMDDQLEYLQGHKFFTSLDMASGYYQIPVAETSKYKTAFVTADGQYEFNRMPFGICTAPAVFQRMVNKILGPLRGTIAVAYLDDILIPSKDFEQGMERLELILKTIKKYNSKPQ